MEYHFGLQKPGPFIEIHIQQKQKAMWPSGHQREVTVGILELEASCWSTLYCNVAGKLILKLAFFITLNGESELFA